MAIRRASRVLAGALIIALAGAAALGGALYGMAKEASDARERANLAAAAEASARAEISRAEEALSLCRAESESRLAAAERARSLEQELALALDGLSQAQGEAERLASLADSRERRATLLSDANDEMKAALASARARAEDGEKALSQTQVMLSEAEEELAGLKALHAETNAALAQERAALALLRERSAEREGELESVYALLTRAEEAYAGASALLGESDESVLQARRLALSRAGETEAAVRAAKAKQEELDRALDELDGTRAALERARTEAEDWREKYEELSTPSASPAPVPAEPAPMAAVPRLYARRYALPHRLE